MYRLIINTKTEFDAAICEDLFESFGSIQVIPYSDFYCIVQGIEIDFDYILFTTILEFTNKKRKSVKKLLLTELNEDIDHNVSLLHQTSLNGFISEIEPPEYLFVNSSSINENLWQISTINV